MKKIIALLIILLILCGCSKPYEELPAETKPQFSKGVWLSYTEINSFIKSDEGFKGSFESAVENFENTGITDLYFHVRSHSDSVFASEVFPQTSNSKTMDFDILNYVINACHKENIKVHAWINPYRANEETETFLSAKGIETLKYNGVYLNPADSGARGLVLDGVGEILTNYDVDGIHFDDYFYPTTDPEFDKPSYEKYITEAKNPLSLADWRRANVDLLIADCKTLIKKSNKKIVFSISPAADIDKNYNSYFADIKGWVQNGYIDEVIPQLYFGFNHPNPDFCFENLLKKWKNLCENTKVSIKIGLAPYKIGYDTVSDGDEWAKNSDILARQSKICIEDKSVDGAVYFSYTHLFSTKEQNTAERENLLKVFSLF